jgi:hypothetical protein
MRRPASENERDVGRFVGPDIKNVRACQSGIRTKAVRRLIGGSGT